MKIEARFYKTDHSKAYVIGGGISSLAAAVYLIREGIKPSQVHILEKSETGTECTHGDAEKGYYLCGTNIIDQEMYNSLFEMLNVIPSTTNPGKTCKEDISEFSKEYPIASKGRLVTLDQRRVDTSSTGLSLKDSSSMSLLLVVPEATLDGRTIQDYFTDEFFVSTFWMVFSTTFAFRTTHSLLEFRRYVKRFMGDFPKLGNMSKFWRTPFNQYESIIQPVEKWLCEQGVQFETNTTVCSVQFQVNQDFRSVDKIYIEKDDTMSCISVGYNDLVFVTLGTLTAGFSMGSMEQPPKASELVTHEHPSWQLWRDIAKRQPDFGRPNVFCDGSEESTLYSYSLTFKDAAMYDRIVQWAGDEDGGLVTFRDSNWKLTLVLPHQPHFKVFFHNQESTPRCQSRVGLLYGTQRKRQCVQANSKRSYRERFPARVGVPFRV
jgi:oleate hydratase